VTAGATVVFDDVAYGRAGSAAVLSGLSLAIEPGECVALVGRSGCGKTTALRLANALLLPSVGSVRVDGRPTTDWDAIRLRRRTGYVIQDVGLFPHRTVAENTEMVCVLEGWPAPRRRQRIDELLALVGLPPLDFATRYPHQLSGGQRQRVGLARALAAAPPLLLLDEPFGALDPVTRRELQDEFVSLRRALGTTALFVTHDLGEAVRVADRLALLSQGRVVVTGTLDDLIRCPDEEARAFAATLGSH
jgi:osmoprotectant transport system ATP-binding protein